MNGDNGIPKQAAIAKTAYQLARNTRLRLLNKFRGMKPIAFHTTNGVDGDVEITYLKPFFQKTQEIIYLMLVKIGLLRTYEILSKMVNIWGGAQW